MKVVDRQQLEVEGEEAPILYAVTLELDAREVEILARALGASRVDLWTEHQLDGTLGRLYMTLSALAVEMGGNPDAGETS